MRLYAGYDMLRTNDGPSAAAYAALRRAGDRLTTVVVAERDDPVLVTDDGRVYTGARAIAAWAGSRCG